MRHEERKGTTGRQVAAGPWAPARKASRAERGQERLAVADRWAREQKVNLAAPSQEHPAAASRLAPGPKVNRVVPSPAHLPAVASRVPVVVNRAGQPAPVVPNDPAVPAVRNAETRRCMWRRPPLAIAACNRRMAPAFPDVPSALSTLKTGIGCHWLRQCWTGNGRQHEHWQSQWHPNFLL